MSCAFNMSAIPLQKTKSGELVMTLHNLRQSMKYFSVIIMTLITLGLTGCDKEPDGRFEENLLSEAQQKRVNKICRAVTLDLMRLESSPIIGFKPMKVCIPSKFGVEIGYDLGTGQTMQAIVMTDPYRIFLTSNGKSRGVCHRINDKERVENQILRECMKL